MALSSGTIVRVSVSNPGLRMRSGIATSPRAIWSVVGMVPSTWSFASMTSAPAVPANAIATVAATGSGVGAGAVATAGGGVAAVSGRATGSWSRRAEHRDEDGRRADAPATTSQVRRI